MMSAATLHYIYDPLCGWCYAVAPLLAAARRIEGLPLQLHGGGLMSGSARRQVTPALRGYVMGNDLRIAELTGQPFGDAYFNGLLRDETAWFDSTPPIAAILAAEACGKPGADMLAALQQAHFVEGKVIADAATLATLAAALDIAADDFSAALAQQLAGPVDTHIEESRHLLQQAGGGGFPTFLLETAKGWQRLDSGADLGKPDQWRQKLAALLAEHGP